MNGGGKFSRFLGFALVLGLGLGGLLFISETARDTRYGTNPAMALLSVIAGAGLYWIAFRGPVGKAIASLLEGNPQVDPAFQASIEARLAYLEQRGLTSGEVDAAFGRIAELEDRLDFTERLLAQAQAQQEPLKEVGRGS